MSKFGSDGGTMNVDISDSSRGEDDQVTIDVDSLTASVENLVSQNLKMSDKCCIFRVPHTIRRHREQAYLPSAFSIGPWHHNSPLVKAAEKVKHKYLKGLLFQARERTTLKELIKAIREIEIEARECYAGPIDVDEEDFAKILVIDGCFLIELFRKDNDKKLREDDDPIFNMSCMLQYLYHDLILVENQIPWFVLERLFDMIVETGSEPPLVKLALDFINNIFSVRPPPLKIPTHRGQKHLLALLRDWLVLSSEKEEYVEGGWEPMPSVTDLVDAGIKLKVGQSSSILDIHFRDDALEIPPLLIQETTEVIIRNLISYEQCCPQSTDIITSYTILLGNLIKTTKDMDILNRSGIIYNLLNQDDSTQFFNNLYCDAYLKQYYYIGLCQRVNKYYKDAPRLVPDLKRKYFRIEWAIVSVLAAALLLILTIVQTIFSIIK